MAAPRRARLAPLTLDCANGSNTEADARTAAEYLDEAETGSLLREAGAAYGAEVKEILLTRWRKPSTSGRGCPNC